MQGQCLPSSGLGSSIQSQLRSVIASQRQPTFGMPAVLRHCHRRPTAAALSLPFIQRNAHKISRSLHVCTALNRSVTSDSLANGTGPSDADPAKSPPVEGSIGGMAGVLDNSSIASMDWNEWMLSSSSSSTDGAEFLLPPGLVSDSNAAATATAGIAPGIGGSQAASKAGAAGAADRSLYDNPAARPGAEAAVPSGMVTSVRITFYAVGASFDRRQLEGGLKAAYGAYAVRKYPDVVHCQILKAKEAQPGADVFFFDFGVLACWGLTPEAERNLVQDLAVPCAVQPLPSADHEMDVFRCTFTTNPLFAAAAAGSEAAAGAAGPAPAAATTPAAAAKAAAAPAAAELGSTAPQSLPYSSRDACISAALLDVDSAPGTTASGSVSGTTSNRRFTRRGERSTGAAAAGGAPTVPVAVPAVAVAATAPPPPAVAAPVAAAAQPVQKLELPPAAGPFSLVYFLPQIANDTVLLHVRHCGDTATLLAVSYALAQSTKMSAFEKAVSMMVEDTRYLPEALAEHGEVHLSGTEIGKLLGKVFVLKRSVNLLSSVASTPEFFWYAPDELQALYTRITQYVELTDRVEQLNGRFTILQEMLELVRAQEENRHGNRLEWIVIWLIVVEVVLGVFELLELFGVIGPAHGA